MKTIMIGLDLATSVFQVHGVDDTGRVVIRRRLRRGQVLGFFAKLPPAVVYGRRAELIERPEYVLAPCYSLA